jgi:hypothetical protein
MTPQYVRSFLESHEQELDPHEEPVNRGSVEFEVAQ